MLKFVCFAEKTHELLYLGQMKFGLVKGHGKIHEFYLKKLLNMVMV
jgi:hypothetical protein